MLVIFLVAQTMMIPILGGLYMGIKEERKRQARLFIVATSRVKFGTRGNGGFGK